MRRHWVAAGIVALLAFPVRAADTYTIDPAHTIPAFEFRHLGLTTQSGRFTSVRGRITLDFPARKGAVDFVVETASLSMGVGTETPGSPGYLLFDVERFPTMTFTSDRLEFVDGRVVGAEGLFTLLGVTRPLHVSVSHFKCATSPLNRKPMCSGNVKATLRRSAFGMVRYIPSISDEIAIDVPVEAYRD